MDPERAKEILAAERSRIEQALSNLGAEGPLEGDNRVEPGDEGSEDLYQDEFNADRTEDLHTELAAVERAEARLAAGYLGLSVESGERFRTHVWKLYRPPSGPSTSSGSTATPEPAMAIPTVGVKVELGAYDAAFQEQRGRQETAADASQALGSDLVARALRSRRHDSGPWADLYA